MTSYAADSGKSWQWFCYGKQPSFPDYISIGEHAALADAYKNWAVGGFEALPRANGSTLPDCNYRFWSKGLGHDGLAFGCLQSSVDSLGRPFFLLIIGMATIPGWQQMWTNLQVGLNEQWQQLSAVGRGRYQTPSEMLTDLKKIPAAVITGPQSQELCPNVWFAGGCGQKREDFRFDEALSRNDFIRLWGLTDEL
jgi:type VI secretion system ImpM family protein